MVKRSGLGASPFDTSGLGIFQPTEPKPLEDSGDQKRLTLRLSEIILPERQARRYFDPTKMAQLVESVREHGVIEPVLVRFLGIGKYELIAGERRYRASQAAELNTIPVVVLDLSDEQSQYVSLIENLQREDLNPVEETEGILHILALELQVPSEDMPSLLYRIKNAAERGSELRDNVIPQNNSSPEDLIDRVADVFNKLGLMSWQSYIKNRLPLLKLPPEILEALRQGQIAYTKATAIAKVSNGEYRKELLDQAIEEGLSLSEIRQKIASYKAASSEDKEKELTASSRLDSTYRRIKRAKVWDDPKKRRKLEKLLSQLETLVEEDPV